MPPSSSELTPSRGNGGNRKSRVSYFYNQDVGHFYYGPIHPMKPHRIKLAHHLILNYGLYRKMDVYESTLATYEELQKFHTEEYVSFLRKITPELVRQNNDVRNLKKFGIGEYTDCPVFPEMLEFCQIYTGCTLDGVQKLNHGLTDIAVNWSGGLHHAKKGEASGFCYINDIVLGILELLKYHARVLYIDIDIHHGDGVEEAFYLSDRVMTVSFHRFGDFFPGTGAIGDIGAKAGKYYSVNVPLKEGIDDETFTPLFDRVMEKVMEVYKPGAVVLQCGADSLTGDRLGCFNLTLKGHADCVKKMKSYGVPLLVLGGGGYTGRNVARCWAYETSVLLDTQISNDIPGNDEFSQYYAPNYKLHLEKQANMENQNTAEIIENITRTVITNLNAIKGAPSVQFQEVPRDYNYKEEDDLPDSIIEQTKTIKHPSIWPRKSITGLYSDRDQLSNNAMAIEEAMEEEERKKIMKEEMGN